MNKYELTNAEINLLTKKGYDNYYIYTDGDKYYITVGYYSANKNNIIKNTICICDDIQSIITFFDTL